MATEVHERDSVMTSLHVTRHNCTPGLTLLVYLGGGEGVGKVGRHFLMENNFRILIDHFSKTYGILMPYLLERCN